MLVTGRFSESRVNSSICPSSSSAIPFSQIGRACKKQASENACLTDGVKQKIRHAGIGGVDDPMGAGVEALVDVEGALVCLHDKNWPALCLRPRL